MPVNEELPGRALTEQELRYASFWVRNRLLLRRIGYGSLIGLNVIFWLFVIWSLLDAYIISYPRESLITTFISQNQLSADSLQQTGPQALQATNVITLPDTAGRKDFLVQVNNNNRSWWPEFDYSFDLGNGTKTKTQTAFVLPNAQRYLAEVGYEASSTILDVQPTITNVRWHRLIPSEVNGSYDNFLANHLQLSTSDVTFKNENLINNQNLGQSTFTLSNKSPYGFWNVDMTVILLRAGSPVAVTTLKVPNVQPNEKRPFTINWAQLITGVNETQIETNVNVLDPKAYLPTTRFQ